MQRFLTGLRLSGYGAAYFFAAGAFMSYWPVWLRDRGVSDEEIGTLFMSRQLMSVLATLTIGWVAHRVGNLRGVILVLAAASFVLMTGYNFAFSFFTILLVTLVWGSVWAPTMALYDGILVTESKARGFTYGSLRLWGSVAFVFGTFVCGVAVDRYGPPWVLYVGLAGILMLAPLALWLPVAAPHERDGSTHAPFGVRDLFRSRPFLLFMIATGLCQASHAVLYSFGTLTWRAAGIDDVTISLLWGESVTVEIVLMMASPWLVKRLGVTGLIGLGLACGMVRWLAMAFTADLGALIILQVLHAGTFAACHLGAMGFIQRAFPANGVALGQSLYYALGTGATQAVIFQLSGLLYARVGQLAFLGMFACSAAGMIALILLVRRWDGGLLVGAK